MDHWTPPGYHAVLVISCCHGMSYVICFFLFVFDFVFLVDNTFLRDDVVFDNDEDGDEG